MTTIATQSQPQTDITYKWSHNVFLLDCTLYSLVLLHKRLGATLLNDWKKIDF